MLLPMVVDVHARCLLDDLTLAGRGYGHSVGRHGDQLARAAADQWELRIPRTAFDAFVAEAKFTAAPAPGVRAVDTKHNVGGGNLWDPETAKTVSGIVEEQPIADGTRRSVLLNLRRTRRGHRVPVRQPRLNLADVLFCREAPVTQGNQVAGACIRTCRCADADSLGTKGRAEGIGSRFPLANLLPIP
ncbi:hypothetical protein ACLQ20_14475 [Micromonospora sp. DT46]|uniref:hypothetical protein n=1 Tax=Micromonospora sp. DT46 TaxID=3393435 RepID=UPI003CEFEEE3